MNRDKPMVAQVSAGFTVATRAVALSLLFGFAMFGFARPHRPSAKKRTAPILSEKTAILRATSIIRRGPESPARIFQIAAPPPSSEQFKQFASVIRPCLHLSHRVRESGPAPVFDE